MISHRLGFEFYNRDVLEVAPELVGKTLARAFDDKTIQRFIITEVEAYRGEEDLACHASKGRTPRTEVMYNRGGLVYVYLIYGMHWMFNIVVGGPNNPQAVLIRGLEGCYGPGRLTKKLSIVRDFYGEDLVNSQRIWVEDNRSTFEVKSAPRIGIDYAGEWASKPWRYYIEGMV